MARERLIIGIPDMQVPDEHTRFCNNMVQFVSEVEPDMLVNVGDFLDEPEPSRWNKGYAGEYAPTLQASINRGQQWLSKFTEAAPNARKHLRMGNHDERIETYVKRYAPALDTLEALRYEALLNVDQYDWQVERNIFDIAPGWVCAHGHEGSLRQYAGGTALSLSVKLGKSVMCGHTHRAGIIAQSVGYNGKTVVTHGLEIGHAMDMRKADYLKTGSGNWQLAFGLLRVQGSRVHPTLVYANPDGSFVVDGVWYGR